MNSINIIEWVAKNNVVNLATDSFWKYIEMYMEEHDDECSNILKSIDLQMINIRMYRVSFSYYYERHQDIYNVYFGIFYIGKLIGEYEIDYTKSAEYINDSLHFDDIYYIWRLTKVYEKTLEIAKNALDEDASVDFISKITGLSTEEIAKQKE